MILTQPSKSSYKLNYRLLLPAIFTLISLSLAANAQKKTVLDSIPSFPDSTVKQVDSATIANEEQLRKEQHTTIVEIEPSPQGGLDKFYQFLAVNLRYPFEDRKNLVQGKVFIQFIVERDGSLTNFSVVRSPSKTLAQEAIRVLQLSPKWRPGIQNGKPVRVQFTVPITFNLGK